MMVEKQLDPVRDGDDNAGEMGSGATNYQSESEARVAGPNDPPPQDMERERLKLSGCDDDLSEKMFAMKKPDLPTIQEDDDETCSPKKTTK